MSLGRGKEGKGRVREIADEGSKGGWKKRNERKSGEGKDGREGKMVRDIHEGRIRRFGVRGG